MQDTADEDIAAEFRVDVLVLAVADEERVVDCREGGCWGGGWARGEVLPAGLVGGVPGFFGCGEGEGEGEGV